MLYLLAQYLEFEGPLNLIRYLSFRSGAAIVTALFIVVGMIHFIKGTRIMLDDYLHGTANRVAIIVSHIFGWGVIATALFALAKMAFTTPVI